jgi:hypothetical protein
MAAPILEWAAGGTSDALPERVRLGGLLSLAILLPNIVWLLLPPRDLAPKPEARPERLGTRALEWLEAV